MSETELRELLEGFRSAGFYAQAFTDEVSFVRWLLSEPRASGDKRQVVYSLAQRGQGPGRHAFVPAAAAFSGLTLLTPDPYFSCLSTHKFHSYTLLGAANLPIPKTWLFNAARGWYKNEHPPLGMRVIAKPNLESASIGIDDEACFEFSDTSTSHLRDLSNALTQAVIVQEFISGWEAETPVIGCRESSFALGPVGVSLDDTMEMGERYLNYVRVYEDQYRFFDFSNVDLAISNQLRGLAVEAIDVLGLTGIARIDFRISSQRCPYITDIAFKPHLTKHSAVAARFKLSGYQYSDIFSALVAASDDHTRNHSQGADQY